MGKGYLGLVLLCIAGCVAMAICGFCGSSIKVSAEDGYLELIRSKKPEEVTLGELYEVSDWVVMGIVEEIEVRVSGYEESPQRTVEETKLIRIRPDANIGRLKIGEAPAEIVIRIPGGEEDLGKDGSWIGGVPQFERDEAVILFLRKIKGTRYYYPAFGARGVYVIEGAEIQKARAADKIKDFDKYYPHIQAVYGDGYYISIHGGRVYNEYLSRKFGREHWSVTFEGFLKELKDLARKWDQRVYKWMMKRKPEEITTRELFDNSGYVVRGTVEAIDVRLAKSEQFPEYPPDPTTLVTIRPREWLKVPEGSQAEEQEIVIAFTGGTVQLGERPDLAVGVYVTRIGGEPRFEVNQDVIVFLGRMKGYRYFSLTLNARSQYIIEDGRVYNAYLGKEAWCVPVDSFLAELRGFMR